MDQLTVYLEIDLHNGTLWFQLQLPFIPRPEMVFENLPGLDGATFVCGDPIRADYKNRRICVPESHTYRVMDRSESVKGKKAKELIAAGWELA